MEEIIYTLCFIVLIFIAFYFQKWLIKKAHRHQQSLIENLSNVSDEVANVSDEVANVSDEVGNENTDYPIIITDDPTVESEYSDHITTTEGSQELKDITIEDRDNVTISQSLPSAIKNIALTRVKPRTKEKQPAPIEPVTVTNPVKPLQITPPVKKAFPYLGFIALTCGCNMILLLVFFITYYYVFTNSPKNLH